MALIGIRVEAASDLFFSRMKTWNWAVNWREVLICSRFRDMKIKRKLYCFFFYKCLLLIIYLTIHFSFCSCVDKNNSSSLQKKKSDKNDR